MSTTTSPVRIFIIAGEASGDIIGAKLCKSFKTIAKAKFMGIGGEQMQKSGVKLLFHYQHINLMGFAEIIFKIPKIWRKINETVEAIIKFQPDCIVTIDSSGFNDRIMKRIRKKLGNKIKAIRYVSSPVWAYRYNRIFRVPKYYDHILLILPFEKKLYDEINCPATYVGHPLVEDDFSFSITKSKILQKYKFGNDAKIITLMPGSRQQEINKMIPIFQAIIEHLDNGKRLFFIPKLSHLKLDINNKNVIVSSDLKLKRQMLKHSNLAIVKSGTSSLETVFYNIPTIVAYKTSIISAYFIRKMIKVAYVSLANIIMSKQVIPEFLQENCITKNIITAADQLLNDKKSVQKQLNNFAIIRKKLHAVGGKIPSVNAAEKILEVINEKEL